MGCPACQRWDHRADPQLRQVRVELAEPEVIDPGEGAHQRAVETGPADTEGLGELAEVELVPVVAGGEVAADPVDEQGGVAR